MEPYNLLVFQKSTRDPALHSPVLGAFTELEFPLSAH
jgi:hypothetical protein